jgi:hypothetical protein
MSTTHGRRRFVPVFGALFAVMVAVLALAPAALAKPNTKTNFFKYDPTDTTHKSLIESATNTGKNPLDVYDIELTQNNMKLSSVMLTIGTTQYPGVCTAQNGGFPVVQCLPKGNTMAPGVTWTITFKTNTVYAAGSQNIWFADDKSGANNGAFTGP